MLVLTRRVGEKLVIGNEVVIEVVSISGDGVRLGVTAPRQTSVHRFEIFAEIEAANQAASQSSSSDRSLEGLAAHLRERRTDNQE
jgi:carbon storage regulator